MREKCLTPGCPNLAEFRTGPGPEEWMCRECTEVVVISIAREASANHPEDKVLERLIAGYDYLVFKEGSGKPS